MIVDLNDVDALVEIADDSLEYLNSTKAQYTPGSPIQTHLDAKRERLQRARDWLFNMLAAERAPKAKK